MNNRLMIVMVVGVMGVIGISIWMIVSASTDAEMERQQAFQETYVKAYGACDAEYAGGRSIIFDCSHEHGDIAQMYWQIKEFHPEISVIKIADHASRSDVYTVTIH